jgi:hypothetical protein
MVPLCNRYTAARSLCGFEQVHPINGGPWYGHTTVSSMNQSQLIARGRNLEEALSAALNEVIRISRGPNPESEASLAIPLRTREPEATALVAAMVANLIAELAEGAQIRSVQIDGLMQRDGDFICWGYAFAVSETASDPNLSISFRDLILEEVNDATEIRCILERGSNATG